MAAGKLRKRLEFWEMTKNELVIQEWPAAAVGADVFAE